MPRTKPNNAGKVMDVCKEIGVEITYKQAQKIVNLAVDFICRLIRRLVKPRSIIALLRDYLKSLEPTGKYFGAEKEIYDLTAQRQKDEIRQPKDEEPTRLTFKTGERE